MSYVTTQPEALSTTAANLAGIGAMMSAQNSAAAAPTTGVVPAAADQVSALAATQFAVHAQMYQAISAQAEAIHQQLVSTLGKQRDVLRGRRSRKRHDSVLSQDSTMDFATLPPEINSARMYAGPGPGPMLAAASAWDALAAELQSTAASLPGGDLRADRWPVAGRVVGRDDRGDHAVSGLDDHVRRTSRTNRHSGPGGGSGL